MREKYFIWIIGPQAVGKMAVGRELARSLDCLFSHNHDSIEFAIRFHPYGTEEFSHLNSGIRMLIREHALKYSKNGFIFTYVMAFNHEAEVSYLKRVSKPFEDAGWKTLFVELQASTEKRLERNSHSERLEAKPSKRDIEASNTRLIDAGNKYVLNSNDEFPFPLTALGIDASKYVKLENDAMSIEDQVRSIAKYFGLKT
ncbi:MAG: shikimate kinase [Candidatus Kariarchaeaceae archaeon]|jgi:DNA polymerase III delta prime subunit